MPYRLTSASLLVIGAALVALLPSIGQDAAGFVVQAVPGADNSGCIYCHLDFDGDVFVDAHLAEGITCVSCHGASDRHRQDETRMVRPDQLWGRDEVAALCRQCHGEHANPPAVEQFRLDWRGRARENGLFIFEDAVCTDCHGWHTIPKAGA